MYSSSQSPRSPDVRAAGWISSLKFMLSNWNTELVVAESIEEKIQLTGSPSTRQKTKTSRVGGHKVMVVKRKF
jgi:hypothetical protein